MSSMLFGAVTLSNFQSIGLSRYMDVYLYMRMYVDTCAFLSLTSLPLTKDDASILI